MKHLFLTALIALHFVSIGQNIYTSRKGPKFLPGHLDIVVTINKNNVRYELFNHWYAGSYAELRQISIPLDSLNKFNTSNDSIAINIQGKKLKLTDKKFNINKKIRHRKLCISPENMRKISYAYKVSSQYKDIMHYDLYDWEDLKLTEEEFRNKVVENVKKRMNNKR